jgi:hypothetical protein
MGLRVFFVLGAIGFAAPLWAANDSNGTASDATVTRPQVPGPEACAGPTPDVAAQASALEPLEHMRRTAEPIARIKRFEPGTLRPTAGPTFLMGPWQQQLFFQRSIDPRNPYYGSGLTR